MTKKQVTTSASLLKGVSIEGEEEAHPAAITVVENGKQTPIDTKTKAETPANSGPSNLFISVKTFDAEGKTVGERIVDMYHFGTRNWLQNHHWWAMHNGHCVETNVATADEVTGYLAASKEALAAKFNTKAVAA
jgi:hypothetical protein